MVAGWKKESLQLRFWNLNSISNSPVAPRWLSCQISTNQRAVETRANVSKHWKTRAKGNNVITNVVSGNQHFASTFLMWIFKFQRRICKLSFLFLPRCQSAPESLLTGPPEHPGELPRRLRKEISPFFFHSAARTPLRACSQDKEGDLSFLFPPRRQSTPESLLVGLSFKRMGSCKWPCNKRIAGGRSEKPTHPNSFTNKKQQQQTNKQKQKTWT